MTAKFIVGDTRAVTATIPDGSVDLILTSPPFLALRSYLPADHESKHLEIGSEANPAAFIDVLLALTAEWRRILAPHGSICIELGDTYSMSGGAGGDYNAGGLRDGQEKFAARKRAGGNAWGARGVGARGDGTWGTDQNESQRFNPGDGLAPLNGGPGWPTAKCLCLVPELYRVALAYGINPLTGAPSPAGRWRVRNVVRWVRPNPPVGALGDKFRPATSDLVVACTAGDRWFDLDAVRTEVIPDTVATRAGTKLDNDGGGRSRMATYQSAMSAGAPPLDWWQIDTTPIHDVIDDVIYRADMAGEDAADAILAHPVIAALLADPGAPNDWWQIVPGGYSGAHYAVWPKELCERPIEAMCPRRVCLTCGKPSRRINEQTADYAAFRATKSAGSARVTDFAANVGNRAQGWDQGADVSAARGDKYETVGWSSCGCTDTDGLSLDGYHSGLGWRPGIVLDPFAGSGTTLVVAHGHSRDSIGIDLDPRNAELAAQRLGMFLETTHHNKETRSA